MYVCQVGVEDHVHGYINCVRVSGGGGGSCSWVYKLCTRVSGGGGDHVHGYINCVHVCQVRVEDHVHGYINCVRVSGGGGGSCSWVYKLCTCVRWG